MPDLNDVVAFLILCAFAVIGWFIIDPKPFVEDEDDELE